MRERLNTNEKINFQREIATRNVFTGKILFPMFMFLEVFMLVGTFIWEKTYDEETIIYRIAYLALFFIAACTYGVIRHYENKIEGHVRFLNMFLVISSILCMGCAEVLTLVEYLYGGEADVVNFITITIGFVLFMIIEPVYLVIALILNGFSLIAILGMASNGAGFSLDSQVINLFIFLFIITVGSRGKYQSQMEAFKRGILVAQQNKELQKANEQVLAMKDEAESANKAKSDFLANMSHEIRTPINAILGMDEMILRESQDKQIITYANNIQISGKSLLALINDILDISKIESGKMEIIPENYDMAELIYSIVNEMQVRAENK